MMAETYKYHLENAAKVTEEPILFAVIGEMPWGIYNTELVPNYDEQPKGKVLPWDEAKKWLDYETSYGYGAPKQNAVYCWTENYIIFMSQYDGSTGAEIIPRNPIDCMPEMPGG